jgi:uncharacterized protein (TIGR02284 family)
MNDAQVRRSLQSIYKIAEAGEKGFATSAASMSSPGLKALLKSYAQQRARFKDEILEELRRLGGDTRPGSSIPGMIHRGRVAIFAAMLIEKDRRERTVFSEAAMGERVAVNTYERALKRDLPGHIQDLLTRQLGEVRKVSEQVQLLHGTGGKRLVVQLFENEKTADGVIQTLKDANFVPDSIEKIPLDRLELHQGRGATVRETVLSGAFGGALWGGLTGILAGFGVLQTLSPQPQGAASIAGIWVMVALGFLLLGAFISSILALFIGVGVSEEDRHEVRGFAGRNQILVRVLTDQSRANDAVQMMTLGARLSGRSIANAHG